MAVVKAENPVTNGSFNVEGFRDSKKYEELNKKVENFIQNEKLKYGFPVTREVIQKKRKRNRSRFTRTLH